MGRGGIDAEDKAVLPLNLKSRKGRGQPHGGAVKHGVSVGGGEAGTYEDGWGKLHGLGS